MGLPHYIVCEFVSGDQYLLLQALTWVTQHRQSYCEYKSLKLPLHHGRRSSLAMIAGTA
jgi:hypothetical protein